MEKDSEEVEIRNHKHHQLIRLNVIVLRMFLTTVSLSFNSTIYGDQCKRYEIL